MKKKINYYLVATALFVAIATMVSMTVINYYLFQKQVKEDLQVMAETIESTGILKQDINEIPQIDVEGIRVTWIDKDGTVLYDNQNDVKKLENHGDRPEVESAFDKGDAANALGKDKDDVTMWDRIKFFGGHTANNFLNSL